MRILLAALIIILSGCVSKMDSDLLIQKTLPVQNFVVRNARVFDGFRFHKNMDVLVIEGKINSLGAELKVPMGVKVIDGTGKTLMPGLIDMHVHLLAAGSPPWRPTMGDMNRTLSANLLMGVTSVVDVGAPLGDISSWTNETGLVLPRFAYAGTLFNVEHGHPSYMIEKSVFWPLSEIFKTMLISVVSSIEAAKTAIDEHKAKGASVIKVAIDEIPLDSPVIGSELLSALVTYAHLQGLKVVAHIGTEQELLKGLDAKVDLFVHGPYRSTFSSDAISRLKQSGTPVVPTTVVFDQLAKFYLKDDTFTEAEQSVLDKATADAYADRPDDLELDEKITAWFEQVVKYRKTKFDIVDDMFEAGIPLYIGSDSPNVANVAGASVHKELALWQAHTSLTPSDILAAATGQSGAWLESYLGWKVGQIKPGYEADLLLIDGDISNDVRKTAHIAQVWMAGRQVVK